eukprot:gene5891-4208_t
MRRNGNAPPAGGRGGGRVMIMTRGGGTGVGGRPEWVDVNEPESLPPIRQSPRGAAVPLSLQPGRRGRGGGGAVATRGRGGALTTTSRGPQATAMELQKNYQGPAKTAKGRAIQEDLLNLGDDFFGGVVSRAPPTHQAGDESDSIYAKFVTSYTSTAVPRRWYEGPVNSEGRFFDASDRNLLCMDVLPARGGKGGGALCVVGSADHGLKVFDVATMREKKNLYTKTCGHTEWVTTCKFLPTGEVLSGGMDSKLCLWNSVLSGPPRCQDLLGHIGSISQVDVNTQGTAISASYDRTLRIWDCSGGGREIGVLSGHKAPVMQFSWAGTQVISGDREGHAKIWDLPTATTLATLSTKRGQIGALCHLLHTDFGNLTMFGDQGGVLTVLDTRKGKAPVFQEELHPGGVLSGIKTIAETPYVVTCGADRNIHVLDPRQNFQIVHTLSEHQDFIYSMETFGNLVLSGASNGWLLVHDAFTGKCCYGLGANTAAVREIFATPEYCVCAGDDGKAAVYDFTAITMANHSLSLYLSLSISLYLSLSPGSTFRFLLETYSAALREVVPFLSVALPLSLRVLLFITEQASSTQKLPLEGLPGDDGPGMVTIPNRRLREALGPAAGLGSSRRSQPTPPASSEPAEHRAAAPNAGYAVASASCQRAAASRAAEAAAVQPLLVSDIPLFHVPREDLPTGAASSTDSAGTAGEEEDGFRVPPDEWDEPVPPPATAAAQPSSPPPLVPSSLTPPRVESSPTINSPGLLFPQFSRTSHQRLSGSGTPHLPGEVRQQPAVSLDGYRDVPLGPTKRDWHYNILGAIFDWPVLCEVYCCQPCQLLRQIQLLTAKGSGISFMHLAILIGGAVVCSPVIVAYMWLGWCIPLCFPCACVVRGKVRARYNISGSCVGDLAAGSSQAHVASMNHHSPCMHLLHLSFGKGNQRGKNKTMPFSVSLACRMRRSAFTSRRKRVDFFFFLPCTGCLAFAAGHCAHTPFPGEDGRHETLKKNSNSAEETINNCALVPSLISILLFFVPLSANLCASKRLSFPRTISNYYYPLKGKQVDLLNLSSHDSPPALSSNVELNVVQHGVGDEVVYSPNSILLLLVTSITAALTETDFLAITSYTSILACTRRSARGQRPSLIVWERDPSPPSRLHHHQKLVRHYFFDWGGCLISLNCSHSQPLPGTPLVGSMSRVYLLGGCRPSLAQQWAIHSAVQRHATRIPPVPPTLRLEQLTHPSVSYVVSREGPPAGRLKVPLSFAQLYARASTATERQYLWSVYYTRVQAERHARDPNAAPTDLISAACVARFERDWSRMSRWAENETEMNAHPEEEEEEKESAAAEAEIAPDAGVQAEAREIKASAAPLSGDPPSPVEEDHDEVSDGEAEDDFLQMLEGKDPPSFANSTEAAPAHEEPSAMATTPSALLAFMFPQRATPDRRAVPPPLFYWEMTLCGVPHVAYTPLPEQPCLPPPPTTTGRRSEAAAPSLWVPITLLTRFPFLRRFQVQQQKRGPAARVLKQRRGAEDADLEGSTTLKWEEDELQQLREMEAPEDGMDTAVMNPTSGGTNLPDATAGRYRHGTRRSRAFFLPQDTERSGPVTDPLTAFPLLFYWWKGLRSEYWIRKLHTYLLSPSFGRAQTAYVMGSGYYINVNETLLSSMVDSSFCVQHRVPLTETGALFTDAIAAVRDVTLRPMNTVGWSRGGASRHRYTASTRQYRGRRRCPAAAMRSRRCSPWHRHRPAAPPSLPSPTTETAAEGAPPPAATETSEAAPENMWLARIEAVHAAEAREQQREEERVTRQQHQGKKADTPAKASMPYRRNIFESPYWIAVDTLEQRWGVTVSAHPSVTFININGKRYVNAENTTDASRFGPLTCTPQRIHQLLGFHGVRSCSWEFSAALAEAYRSAAPLRQPHPAETARPPKTNLPSMTSPPVTRQPSEESWRTCNLWVSLRLVRAAQWAVVEGALLVHLDADRGRGSGTSLQSRLAKTSRYDSRKGFGAYLFMEAGDGRATSRSRRPSPKRYPASAEASPASVWGEAAGGKYEKPQQHKRPDAARFCAECFTNSRLYHDFVQQIGSLPDTVVNAADIVERDKVLWMMSYAPCILLRSPRCVQHGLPDETLLAFEKDGGGGDERPDPRTPRFEFPPSRGAGDRQRGHRDAQGSGGGAHGREQRYRHSTSEALAAAYMEKSLQLHTCLAPSSRVLMCLFSLLHHYAGEQTPQCLPGAPQQRGLSLSAPRDSWVSKQFLEDEPRVSLRRTPTPSSTTPPPDNAAAPLPSHVTVTMHAQPLGGSWSPRRFSAAAGKAVPVFASPPSRKELPPALPSAHFLPRDNAMIFLFSSNNATLHRFILESSIRIVFVSNDLLLLPSLHHIYNNSYKTNIKQHKCVTVIVTVANI